MQINAIKRVLSNVAHIQAICCLDYRYFYKRCRLCNASRMAKEMEVLARVCLLLIFCHHMQFFSKVLQEDYTDILEASLVC